jgi:hypothetical protein
MQPWERAGVTREEWVAARLEAAGLLRAVDKGEPEPVRAMLERLERRRD